MKFHGYDKEKREFSVEFERGEAEDLRRVMQGIADHVDELDKAAMGVYSREEAMVMVKDLDRVLEAFPQNGISTTILVKETQLLNINDALSGIFDLESENVCASLGMPSQKMKEYFICIGKGMRSFWENVTTVATANTAMDKKN